MTHRPQTTRFIIISFMIMASLLLARCIYTQNTIGVVLAFISLCAGIYFVHLFNKAKAEIEEAEWRERMGNQR